MNLSNRLESLFQLIPENSVLVDIGTDHGLLMIRAIESKKSVHAYGLDINKLPLASAKANVKRHKLEDKIELYVSDGLKSFDKEGTCFVLAGMGAETIFGIIDAYEFNPSQTLIIQSNTKHPWLRETLCENGFEFIDEVFMMDKGIPVFIMVVNKGNTSKLSFEDAVLGPILKNKMNKEYTDYLVEYHNHLNKIKHNQKHLEETFKVLDEIVGKESSYE